MGSWHNQSLYNIQAKYNNIISLSYKYLTCTIIILYDKIDNDTSQIQ